MQGAHERKVALVERENAGDVQPLGNRDDRGVNKVNAAVGILNEEYRRCGQDRCPPMKRGDISTSAAR